ncbi:MAG: ABC transporter ATP-binding protein, partial [Rhodospirillales bacterium]
MSVTPQAAPASAGTSQRGLNDQIDEQLFGNAFDAPIIRRFLSYIKPYRKRFLIALGAVIVFTLSQLTIPLVVRSVIDTVAVAGAANAELLNLIALGFLGLIVINLGAMYVQETFVGKLGERVLFDLRRAMYVHLQRLSMSFMDKTEVGRLMSRLQGDVGALQEFLDSTVAAMGDILLLFGIVTVLVTLNWQLGLLTLSVVLMLFIVRLIWLPMARKAFLRARQTSSTVNGALAENINGVRIVQGMIREGLNFERFELKAADNLDAHLKASKLSNVMVPIVDTLTGGAMAIVVVVGGNMVLGGALDLGVMVAFIFYVQRFFDPIRSLTIQYSVMQRAMASGRRIFEVLDVPIDLK